MLFVVIQMFLFSFLDHALEELVNEFIFISEFPELQEAFFKWYMLGTLFLIVLHVLEKYTSDEVVLDRLLIVMQSPVFFI